MRCFSASPPKKAPAPRTLYPPFVLFFGYSGEDPLFVAVNLPPMFGQLAVVGIDADPKLRGASRGYSRRMLGGLRAKGWKLRSVRSPCREQEPGFLAPRYGRSVDQSYKSYKGEARRKSSWEPLQRWIQPAQDWRALIRVSRQESLAAIISVPGCASHHAQAAWARRHLGLPWIAVVSEYERSLLRPGQAPRSPLERGLHYAYQQLFLDADTVVVDSDGAREYWSAQLPAVASRCRRIYSLWDADPAPNRGRSPRGPISLRVCNAKDRPASLRPLLSVLEVLRDRFPELSGAIEIRVQGAVLADEIELCRQWKIGLGEGDEGLGEAELLVVLARGSDAEIPSPAFWPAFASGRPVISMGGSDEVGRLLRKTGLGLHINWNERGWVDRGAAVLQRAIFRRYNARSLLAEYSPRLSTFAEFSVSRGTEQLESLIHQLRPSPRAIRAEGSWVALENPRSDTA